MGTSIEVEFPSPSNGNRLIVRHPLSGHERRCSDMIFEALKTLAQTGFPNELSPETVVVDTSRPEIINYA